MLTANVLSCWDPEQATFTLINSFPDLKNKQTLPSNRNLLSSCLFKSPARGGEGGLLTLTWNENKGDNWWYTCLQLKPLWLWFIMFKSIMQVTSFLFGSIHFIRTLPFKFLLKTILKASLYCHQVSLWLAYLCRLKTNKRQFWLSAEHDATNVLATALFIVSDYICPYVVLS